MGPIRQPGGRRNIRFGRPRAPIVRQRVLVGLSLALVAWVTNAGGGDTILLVTPTVPIPPGSDADKKALMESWGYTVLPISASAPQVAFDTAVTVSKVAYVSEEIVSGNLGTKLRNACIGVVIDEDNVTDEFGISSTSANYTSTDTDVVNNSHSITQPFSLGVRPLAVAAQPLHTVAGTIAPGAVVLTEQPATANGSLVIIDVGGVLYDSGTAAGRRVYLPWGGDAFDVNDLNADGRLVMRRALEWAAAGDACFDVSGTVFEDPNYGGGGGRDYATANASAQASGFPATPPASGDHVGVPNATVELYNNANRCIATTATDALGAYSFSARSAGVYTVRVVNRTVASNRTGYVASLLPVQTFRASGDADTNGSADPDPGRVGGTAPALVDPGPVSSCTSGGGDSLPAQAQSIGTFTVTTSDMSSVDFGFNFDTVVNTNDAQQGSLRQFILNSNSLGNTNLDQAGLTAGDEASLFMLPSSTDPFGRPTDPNYNGGTGVFTITPVTILPAIVDSDTTLDGTTQTNDIGNTNTAVLGAGGTVGVNGLTLGQVAGPEVEIRVTGSLTYGVRIQANNAVLRGLAILGFGTATAGEGAIHLANNVTGAVIENNVLGSTATSFTDPGAALRNSETIYSNGADGGTIRNNLIGFGGIRGIFLLNASTGWTVNGNELRDNARTDAAGDGLALDSGAGVFTGNLIVGSSSQGIVVTNSSSSTFTNNTVGGNGVGLTSASGAAAGITLRSTASSTVVDRNVLRANYAAGISVNDGATGIRITRNSIFDNGTIIARNGDPATGQIGIDLNSPTDDSNRGTLPFFTLNDPGDSNPGGNDLLNFPVLDRATIDAGNLSLTGWARPGSVIELFVADADPTGFGEGQTWKITLAEGGTGSGGDDPYADLDASSSTYGPGPINGIAQGQDTTNRFLFSFPLPAGVGVGTRLTATARDGAGNTSEFGGFVTAALQLVIVKRAFLPDGSPIGTGFTVPKGSLIKFMFYINNAGGPVSDTSVRDVLDPAFAYIPGSIKYDNSVSNCAAATCTPAEEAVIFAAADAASARTDVVDGDAVSHSGNTIDAGNQSMGNAQLNILANRVWAVVFTVKVQ